MNCRTFEKAILRLEDGRFLPPDKLAAEAHAAGCFSCRRLLEIARGELNLLPQKGAPELTGSILNQTSGSACGRAQSQLCDFIDGILDPGSAELVSQHVEFCTKCGALATSLAELREVLPSMAEMRPDAHFVPEILWKTAGRRRFREDPSGKLRGIWMSLIRRPRFSFEAAYVGTLAIALFFGNPLPALQALSSRALDSASQVAAGPLFAQTFPPIDPFKAAAAWISAAERDLSSIIAQGQARSGAMVSKVMAYHIDVVRAFWSRGVYYAANAWRHLRSGAANPHSRSSSR